MNLLAFQSLCRHVSQALAADDIDALGESRPTTLQGETFELLWQPEGTSAVLLTYLGRVDDEHARQVYEQLLLVQLTGWDNPDLRFGFDPVTGQVLLCTRLPALSELEEGALTALLQRLLAQLEKWRGELLKPVQVETPFARFMAPDDMSAADQTAV